MEYTLGLYEKSMPQELSWREKLGAAKEAGFDFIEISIDETQEKLARLDMGPKERLELVALMKTMELPIRTMCLSGHRKYPLGSSDTQIAQRGMEIMEKAIQLADDLGIRIIQLAGYDVYYEPSTAATKERFYKNLKKATMMAAKAGVILGFETMETEFMNTVKKAMDYVCLIDSVYLQVYPDVGNITNAALQYDTDVLQDLQLGKGHLVAVHLKETLPGKFREIPFGEGHVNFAALIHVAWQAGVRKYVAEFWDTNNAQWKEELVKANAMMRQLLDKEKGEESII